MSLPAVQQQQQQQQQQQPPGGYVEGYRSRGSGSVGPVIAVLAVILVLGVVAAVIGRLCSGRRVWGLGQYDLEGWIERKCASCIDGRVSYPPPPPPPPPPASVNGATTSSSASETSSQVVKPVHPTPEPVDS